MTDVFSLKDYDYTLPEELIAQEPAAQREQSRLLSLNRATGEISHYGFGDLNHLLDATDVLVVNNTEVIPGRFLGKKDSGGKAELLILDYAGRRETKSDGSEFICKCLIKSSKRPRAGTMIFFDRNLRAKVLDFKDGVFTAKIMCEGDFENILYQIGRVPLPPYIKRDGADNPARNDKVSYQTVYASQKGAIAAPTAGLHFSTVFLDKLKAMGIKVVELTLHVGYGTFLAVRVSDIRTHKMHVERFSVSQESADIINHAKSSAQRIVAVGTTCVRTLEYASDPSGHIAAGSGECDLFIYPGYTFKVADAMLTNFHLPQSTLLMLISAFAGRSSILKAYQEAIRKRYRFYSYGDAMFIS